MQLQVDWPDEVVTSVTERASECGMSVDAYPLSMPCAASANFERATCSDLISLFEI